MQAIELQTENCEDTSEWKLFPTVFKQLCSQLGTPFASRLCHQLSKYIAWQLEHSRCSSRCISTGLDILISLRFSSILNNRKSTKETSKRQEKHDHCYTWFAEPIMVSNLVKDESPKFNSFTKVLNNLLYSELQLVCRVNRCIQSC